MQKISFKLRLLSRKTHKRSFSLERWINMVSNRNYENFNSHLDDYARFIHLLWTTTAGRESFKTTCNGCTAWHWRFLTKESLFGGNTICKISFWLHWFSRNQFPWYNLLWPNFPFFPWIQKPPPPKFLFLLILFIGRQFQGIQLFSM